jgi:hypothetical protein
MNSLSIQTILGFKELKYCFSTIKHRELVLRKPSPFKVELHLQNKTNTAIMQRVTP